MSQQPLRKTLQERFWAKTICSGNGCWGWKGAKHNLGYGVVGKGRRGEGNIRATHVSWMIHFGVIPKGLWVLHKCDNPECCRPEHLFLGTPKDNVHDCIEKGRANFFPYIRPTGLHNPKGKLSDTDIRSIRMEYKHIPPKRFGRVEFLTSLAVKYNISYGHIKAIVANRVRKGTI